MDAVDRMLAELKAKYNPSELPAPTSTAQPVPASSSQTAPGAQSLDELLRTIHADTRRAVRASLSAKTASHSQPQRATTVSAPMPVSEPSKRQRTISLTDAHRWLQHIKPSTEEGLWFEEFALHYSSRLEAAIDYLAALQNAT
jgi:hypothetical protein